MNTNRFALVEMPCRHRIREAPFGESRRPLHFFRLSSTEILAGPKPGLAGEKATARCQTMGLAALATIG